MVELSKSRGMSPRELGAMKDCVEVLGDAVDQLQRSIGEMGKLKGSNFQMFMSDIQTWVSAALTNEDTCTEGFAGNAMNGKVKTIVRGRIVNVAQLTSNALALVNQFASLHA
jgi:pectinesterase inhibitor-like protein